MRTGRTATLVPGTLPLNRREIPSLGWSRNVSAFGSRAPLAMPNSRAKRSMRRRRKRREREAIAASVSGLAIAAEVDLRIHRELAVGAEIHEVPHERGTKDPDLPRLRGPIRLIQHGGFRARRQQILAPADIGKDVVDRRII